MNLVEGLEHGAEQGPRIERIVVLADPRHTQERGKTTIQGSQLLGAIAGGACGKLADGQITLEIVGVDQTQLVGLAHRRRFRCRLQDRDTGVETGDIGTAELLQKLCGIDIAASIGQDRNRCRGSRIAERCRRHFAAARWPRRFNKRVDIPQTQRSSAVRASGKRHPGSSWRFRTPTLGHAARGETSDSTIRPTVRVATSSS